MAVATPSVPPNSGEPRVVAGRYVLEALLGQGGAGEVWRVRDTSTGRHRAMKILRANATAKQVALFEREYHTLAGLRHPHIIEAYDYGTHGDRPFYTMEILEGADMTALAPMPWRDACRVLRDVASALALLHARKLLHRDVSARNVWRTHEGHIKLLDFGALTGFGSPGDITGTPPFVAPEAVRGQVLDQRTDLYAVGALGYFLLTGRHAYPAHSFRELLEVWEHAPPAPSSLVRALGRADLPEVPAELDALIEALLRRDLRARPANAPELIDRLIAVASLEPEARTATADDYLQSTLFVGRVRERSELRAALKRAAQGEGGCALIEGAPGVGRSRLLAEVALDAQLAGATVLHVDARMYEGVNAVALALANKLLDALPREARALAAAHARVLGHLSPELCARLEQSAADLESMPVTPGEARMRIQAALREWFLAVARKNALAVLIDDLEAVDEASAAFLAALGRKARDASVLVVCTLRTSERELGSAAHVFRQFATTYKLKPLRPEETLELLGSLFGDAPNLARLAERLHRVSQGNPDHLMHLAEHLLRKGLVVCRDGTWVLPFDLDQESLPATRTEAWRAQLTRLSEDGRALVEALSVEDGSIPIEACGAVVDMEPAAVFAALGELEREGLLVRSPGGYLFVDEGFRDAVRASLSPERARAAHRRLGEVRLAAPHRSSFETLKAGLHLLRGGAEREGSALIAASLAQGSSHEVKVMDPTEIAQVAPILEQAFATFQAQGRSEYQLVMLASTLASLGYYADRRYAERYAERAMSLLERVLELSLIRRASAFLGRKLGLFLGLAVAAVRIRRARRKDPTVPDLRECVRLLLSCVGALTGVATICIDPRKAMSLSRVVEPFTALGKDHAATMVYEFCRSLSATVQDRVGEAHARWERMLARLRSKVPIQGMSDEYVTLYRAGALYALGVIETWRDSPRALEIAEELESFGMKLYQMSADQVRMVYYANQGNMQLAERYRERVEMHAIQRGTAWQVETWAPGAMITVYLRTFDARHEALRGAAAPAAKRHPLHDAVRGAQPRRLPLAP